METIQRPIQPLIHSGFFNRKGIMEFKRIKLKGDDGYHYDITPRIKEGNPYSIIYGERGNGKTTEYIKFIMEAFYHTGAQGVYTRRYSVDMKASNMSKLCDNLILKFDFLNELTDGEWDDVYYESLQWYFFSSERNEKCETPFMYGIPVREMSKFKSVPFPNVKYIGYDEALAPLGESYLDDEVGMFMNIVSTVFRDEDDGRQVFLFGNTVTTYCPFFDELGLKAPTEYKIGSITRYQYLYNGSNEAHITVEYCESRKAMGFESKATKFYAFGTQAKMITEGKFALPVFKQYKKDKLDKPIFTYYIETNNQLYRATIIKLFDSKTHIINHEPTYHEINDLIRKDELIYTTRQIDYYKHLTTLNSNKFPISRKIYELYRENKVTFSNSIIGANVGMYLNEGNSKSFNNF